jgi:hypothetical protein
VDGAEFILLLILAAIGGSWASRTAHRVFENSPLIRGSGRRIFYALLYIICHVVLWIVLATQASREVRQDLGLQALFVAGGMTAVAGVTEIVGIFGLHAVDDGIERNNPAARAAVAGLWIATTLCSIAANLGEGDFVGTTFAPLAIALMVLLTLCAAYSAATRGFAVITVERDRAAGIRFAGWVIAASIPLAKASRGDWVSLTATLRDFALELPALALGLALALGFEMWIRRSGMESPINSWKRGVGPAALYLGVAASLVRWIQ